MSRIVEALDNMCESNNTTNNTLKTFKSEAERFWLDYKDIKSKENDWDYIDDIYDMKKDFYNKYIDFARRCKELSSIKGITGYGLNDASKLKLMEICREVDYNFPYGWK